MPRTGTATPRQKERLNKLLGPKRPRLATVIRRSGLVWSEVEPNQLLSADSGRIQVRRQYHSGGFPWELRYNGEHVCDFARLEDAVVHAETLGR